MARSITDDLDRFDMLDDMEKLEPYLEAAAILVAGRCNGTPTDPELKTVVMAIKLRRQVEYHAKHGLI